YTGVSFAVRRPFMRNPGGFYQSATWEVRAEFRDNISTLGAEDMLVGQSVLYRPSGEVNDPELRKLRGRFLGRVREILPDQRSAVVFVRDQALKLIPLHDLYLEASSEAIKEFESRLDTGTPFKPTWYRIQELNFVL